MVSEVYYLLKCNIQGSRNMLLIICLMFNLITAAELGNTNVVYVILSQGNDYHSHLALNLKNDLLSQYKSFQNESPTIYLSHKDLPHIGGWTIFPLIPKLVKAHSSDRTSWIFFIEDYTSLNVSKLIQTLKKYDSSEDVWVGHALSDKEGTIIHHFAFYQNPGSFKYPNTASGFAISMPLFKKLSKQMVENASSLPSFSIDKSHELALFLREMKPGYPLTNEPNFCISTAPNCATFPKVYFSKCDNLISNEVVYFAVKTYEKFHEDRVPVVKSTWGKQAEVIRFFSDIEDDSIPTINLGIPNTEKGHCAKTLAILNHIKQEDLNGTFFWVVVADDDTILSVQRLLHLLSCYNPNEQIALGERYGFQVAQSSATGYNYPTGGAGMVFSRLLVNKIVEKCKCPRNDSPDDMYLGACLKEIGVDVVHSPAFHQARPGDYSLEYLQNIPPVSFHKHWMIDAVEVYKNWFENNNFSKDNNTHIEL